MKEKAYTLFKEKLALYEEIALDEKSTIIEIDAAKNAALMYLPAIGGPITLLGEEKEDELVSKGLTITEENELYLILECKHRFAYLKGKEDILKLFCQIYNIKDHE